MINFLMGKFENQIPKYIRPDKPKGAFTTRQIRDLKLMRRNFDNGHYLRDDPRHHSYHNYHGRRIPPESE